MDPLLDPEIIEDFDYLSRKQGRDVYAEMVGRLASSWPERLQQMEAARAQASAAGIARGLHALKGTAAALGLRRLAARAGSAEQMAQSGAVDVDLSELAALVEQSLSAARAHRPG